MANSYYFQSLDEEKLDNSRINRVLEELESYAEQEKKQIYVIDEPVSEKKYKYEYQEAIVVLIPKVKILVINFGTEQEQFNDYFNDFIEDLGYISDKYEYKSFLGRPREWKANLIKSVNLSSKDNIHTMIEENDLSDIEARKGELLISLLTGSINDIDRVDGDVPTSSLEQIKKNIVLFDGEQTRFIFQQKKKKRVTIQGLAGTGKTELLLHKLKNIYVNEENSRIFFTCFNKILSQNLKERIPDFFDFMKVEEQIKWDERLWVERSWGSQANRNSGVYSFICNHYGIPFQRYRWGITFEKVCNDALDSLNQLEEDGSFEPFFDYILIDESQDFNESFFQLCEKVTGKQVYIAGDIFQNIYDYSSVIENKPDFLLNKVYRTDPKTLMFAHTIGFGLLERPVIRWLSDEEWEACGYNIDKDGKNYTFSREPLKRFENLKEDIISLKLAIAESDKYLDEVLWSIRDIKENNPTVEAEDIGVVFLENEDKNYVLADELSIKLDQEFGWSSVKGYEVKSKVKDHLFISNRNNIKGLEFPFIICITATPLNIHTSIRNSLYMMLTRSFITSYLILSEDNGQLNAKLEKAVEAIMKTGKLKVEEPKPSEIMEKSKLMLEASGDKSQYEIVEDILLNIGIKDFRTKEKMHRLVNVMLKDSVDSDKIYKLISQNIDFT